MLERRRRGRPRQLVVDAKRVYLTPEAVDLVTAFADRQGMNFSAAVETLCRLGLTQAPPDAYAGALEAAVRGVAREEMGRQTALLASASVDAHAAFFLAFAVASRGLPRDQAAKLRQDARDAARRTLRTRASVEGREQLRALLAGEEL